MAGNNISDDVAAFRGAVVETPRLRTWFLALHDMVPTARRLVLSRMALEMRAGGEDRALIAAIVALEKTAVYEAAYQTVIELYGSE